MITIGTTITDVLTEALAIIQYPTVCEANLLVSAPQIKEVLYQLPYSQQEKALRLLYSYALFCDSEREPFSGFAPIAAEGPVPWETEEDWRE